MALFWATGFAVGAEPVPARSEESTIELRDTGPAYPATVAVALEKAAKSGRDVAVVFNVPDWGGWCERIRKDILDQPKFATAADKAFAIARVDFPRKEEGPMEARKIASAYAKRYQISGYPVVLLLDKNGRAYARTGYREGGPVAYANHLGALRHAREKRDEQLERSRKNQGYIRTDLLSGALATVDLSLIRDYADLFEELRGLDTKDRRGVVADYDIARLITRVKENVAESRNRAAGLWEFDAFLAGHPDLSKTRRQRVLLARFAYVPKSGEDGLSGIARCQRHLEELNGMLALDPKSSGVKDIRALIESEEAQLDRLRSGGR